MDPNADMAMVASHQKKDKSRYCRHLPFELALVTLLETKDILKEVLGKKKIKRFLYCLRKTTIGEVTKSAGIAQEKQRRLDKAQGMTLSCCPKEVAVISPISA